MLALRRRCSRPGLCRATSGPRSAGLRQSSLPLAALLSLAKPLSSLGTWAGLCHTE